MPTINDYLTYAETALASYAQGLVLGSGANSPRYQVSGMAESQAARFDQQWSVLDQADIGDGFSAVLFQRVDASGGATGEKVLGIRGTEASHWGIDFAVDVIDVALLGTTLGMAQYQSLEAFYQRLVGAGKLAANEQLTVSGHSLGGFLAQAFAAEHDAVVRAAYTYNAPGLSVNVTNIGTQLLEFFGIVDASIPNGKVFNARALDGLSVTAGLGQMVGSVDTFNIENGSAISNHSIVTLTDSLAVQAALQKLDAGATPAAANQWIQMASNQGADTLERLLDGVRRTLFGPAVIPTAVGDHNALYANLADLETRAATFAGKVRIDPSRADLGAKARNDFAALASLITLSPVVLAATDGNQGALDATLRTVWGQTYLDWEADKSMPQADRDAGMLTFSDQWIADRALLVAAVGLQNQRDIVTGQEVYDSTVPAGKRYEFQYYGGTPRAGETQPPLQTLAYARTSQVTSPQFIAFGDDTANLVQGTPNLFADHLYGAAGNDSITGLAGADHLEGNAGADTLDGGSGNDTLLGGTDDDFLEGSTGADTLLGGAGSDTYFFNTAGWGDDVIIDSDGQGSLRVPGYDAGLPQGKRQPNGKYETPTQDVTYTVQQITPTRKDLYIEFANRADTITIRNWSPGALGITLDDSIAPLVPNYVDTGDAQPNRLTAFHDPDGAGPLEGEYVRDVSLAGGQGDDTVLGYIGNDILQGGAGSDIVLGEASVIVVTSPPAGEPGDDRIFGDGEVEIDSAIAQGNVQTPSGVKGDWLGGWDDEDGHSSSRVSWRGSRRPNDEFKRLESVIGCHRRDSVGARRSPQAGLAAIAWSDACAG